MEDLTAFQRETPCVIAGLDEPHGLAIKGVLDEYYGDEVHHGQLYPNLNTLVEKELVKKGEIDKRTNCYQLADRGEHEIKARREWEAEHVALEAWLSLTVGTRCPTMTAEKTQRLGWRVFELAEANSPRNCGDNDCDGRAWFYVHDHGFSCKRHLPEGASSPR